ncbi:hypothetical protein AYI69_g359 [Smittium culicis]|uniref:Uncharacterized protein n=1 Tax=Smittium culicis TaxID=133412 RepID=A0A1R1YT95_9FUNG|nr:hypothetical protein AYI69_g359 [Smittium culicis]
MIDHQDIKQISMSQDQFKELTEMVKELLRDKERNAEPEDPYVTTRIPLTDLTIYPELIEALTSIEEDFFPRIQRSDLESLSSFAGAGSSAHKTVPAANLLRRKPRTVKHRPSHPKTTPSSQTLAGECVVGEGGIIRPHGRIPGTGQPRDVSVNMDQVDGKQLGTQHLREWVPDPVPEKGTNFNGFVRKIVERFDEEAAPPTTAGGVAAADTPPVAPQKKNGRYLYFYPDGGSRIPDFEERNRTGQDTVFRLLQQLFCHRKEDRGTHSGPRPEKTESACGGKGFKVEILVLELSTNLPEGLHQVSGSRGRDERSLQSKNSQSLFRACETRIPNQAREIEYETMSVDNPSGNGHQFSEYDAQNSFIQGPGPKKGSFKDIECGSNEPKKFSELH